MTLSLFQINLLNDIQKMFINILSHDLEHQKSLDIETSCDASISSREGLFVC